MKLSIFSAERDSSADYDAIRVELFAGTSVEDAVTSFKKVVFKNEYGLLYATLDRLIGDNDSWEADDSFSNCIVRTGNAVKMAVDPHYRFYKTDKGSVKVDKTRIVRFVKLVNFGNDPIENELARYVSQIPDAARIENADE